MNSVTQARAGGVVVSAPPDGRLRNWYCEPGIVSTQGSDPTGIDSDGLSKIAVEPPSVNVDNRVRLAATLVTPAAAPALTRSPLMSVICRYTCPTARATFQNQ